MNVRPLLHGLTVLTAGVACAATTALAREPAPAIGATNRPPSIQADSPECSRPSGRPRVCAFVVDDKAVASVRTVFRAANTTPYYWTEMAFDGTRYCAWLPQPRPDTKALEYYVEAFDEEYEASRSRGFTMTMAEGCAALEVQPPSTPAIVRSAKAGQPSSPVGFEPATFRLPAEALRER